MFNFFDQITNFFSNGWSVISNHFTNLTMVLKTISQIQAVPGFFIGILPGFLYTFMIIILGVGVVKLLLGWGNS